MKRNNKGHQIEKIDLSKTGMNIENQLKIKRLVNSKSIEKIENNYKNITFFAKKEKLPLSDVKFIYNINNTV